MNYNSVFRINITVMKYSFGRRNFMSRKTRQAVQTGILCLLILLVLPLIVLAVIYAVPSVGSAAYSAADASVELAMLDFFSNSEQETQQTEISADKSVPEETAAVIKQYSGFEFDDSMMLSIGTPQIPSSENEEIYVENDSYDVGPEPYPESLESHDGEISAMTYGYFSSSEYIPLEKGGQVRNVTSVSNKKLLEESKQLPDFKIELNDEPQVLIMHTHTTESYEPYQRGFYDSSFNSRTTDPTKSVIAVGNQIAYQLEQNGIGVIHDTTLHDYPSYNGSYDRSRVTVKKILEENPSIKIVLDIHRDAIEKADGCRVAPTTEINGKSAAQVMIICGCDDGTMNMPNYMKNFRFASLVQQQMESDYPTLTRPVLFDYRKYNQDLTTGSILVEVGGHANSIDQAIYSGELIGKSLANALISISE
jgi:stage II sporulation protein P